MKHRRVLLLAEQCNPEWTSVPLVSWYYYSSLRERLDVHLVTQVRNREALLRAGLTEGEDFTAIDSECMARPIWRVGSVLRGGKGKGWTTVMALNSLSYYYFEHLLWKRFGPAIRRGEYDVVHRLMPLSPAIPSIISSRCRRMDVPFVVGPMNGGLPWPRGFRGEQKREREWLSNMRSLMRLLPRWRSTYRDAACVLSGSRTTWRELEPLAGRRHVYMIRNGVDVGSFSQSARPGVIERDRPLALVFVGRLVPLKGCDMLLEAVAPLMRAGSVTLTLVGDGPERDALERLCEEMRISEHVTFTGNVPHAEVTPLLHRSDVFVFPSIREFGGAVVLEAMSCGVPVVVMDYGGPGELASADCGVLIPLESREQIVRDLRDAIAGLEADRSRVESMGRAGRRRAEEQFDWAVKAGQLVDIYEWVLGAREKPEFGVARAAAAEHSRADADAETATRV